MWFRFAKGHEAISIEQQEFRAEAKDAEGYSYFRAPNHFAPKILALAGYAVVDPPDADGPDNDQERTDKDTAITQLSQELEAAKEDARTLRENANSASAEFIALRNERDVLAQQVADLTRKVSELSVGTEDGELNGEPETVGKSRGRVK